MTFNKVFDDIENNNFDKAKKDLELVDHYEKYWLSKKNKDD